MCLNFIPYDLSNFLFAFAHNQVYTKDRISHFSNNTDRTCSFCKKMGPLPAPSESFLHSFFFCRMANTYIKAYENLTNITVTEKLFFMGFNDQNLSKDVLVALNIDLGITKFFINTVRTENLGGVFPSTKAFFNFLIHYKTRMKRISKKYSRLCLLLERYIYSRNLDDLSF